MQIVWNIQDDVDVNVKTVCPAHSCCLIEIGITNQQASKQECHSTTQVTRLQQTSMKANPEVVEGDRGVVRKQGAQLVQAGQHDKGAAVMLGRQSHDMCPHRGHDATIGQHSVSPHQNLHTSHCLTECLNKCFSLIPAPHWRWQSLSGDGKASVVTTVSQWW